MTKQELNYCIDRDAFVAGVRRDILHKIWYVLFPVYSYNYIRLIRRASYYKSSQHWVAKLYGFYLSIIAHKRASKLGFYIPEANFGPGLYIPHSGSITINPNAIIGANCQINANVVIGQSGNGTPIIGDNVFIGAGAVVCGDIRIADNVWIGANSVVTKSILEPNVLVAGIPAKIVSKKRHNWLYVFNLDRNGDDIDEDVVNN